MMKLFDLFLKDKKNYGENTKHYEIISNNKENFLPHELIDNRQIRIFISSTFKDMQPERNYLINHVFPGLKRYCAERDVTLIELDLRWGVTEEESKQGKVVEICLKEIENTHPFFIGLLGERYGWIPNEKEQTTMSETLKKYPWLIKDLSEDRLSITEIEMQYGVLRSEDKMNAYFYFRSPEMKTPEVFKEKPNSPEEQKQQRLKNEIRTQTKYPKYDYTSVEDLGAQVERDFKTLVNKLFPNNALSELEKERLQQKAFLRSRTGVYIRNAENIKRLDDFVQNDNSAALVVTGESGLGKSALIANWIDKQARKPDYELIYHFVGNSGAEGDYRKITQRLINEIKAVYDLSNKKEIEIQEFNDKSNNTDRQKEELEKLLFLIANKGKKLLIVLDGVNQLADIDNAKLLNWLPVFPKNVKVIYSTLTDDTTMEVFIRRGYEMFELKPLNKAEQAKLIEDYLKLFSKSLLPKQVERIAADKKMDNTLALRTLLDELRVFGIHEEIDTQIANYLSAEDLETFFDKVLQRFETTYNYDKTNFAGNVFSLLAVSRAGLSETELLTMTNAAPLYWSQLYNGVFSHLTVKNGLINFSHQFLRNAVWKRYLSKKAVEENKFRNKIVVYMETSTNVTKNRKYDELPYQLYELRNSDKLYHYLLNLELFEYIGQKDMYELGMYWQYLIKIDKEKYTLSKYDTELTLSGLSERKVAEFYNNIASFINIFFVNDSLSLTYIQKALELRKKFLGKNHPETAESHYTIGNIYRKQADYQQALFSYQQALSIWENTNGVSPVHIALICHYIGGAYHNQGNYSQALNYYQKALSIRENILGNNHPQTADSYNDIGCLYMSLCDYPQALIYLSKALEINENILGVNHPDTANSYNNMGSAYHFQKNYMQALTYLQKGLGICEKVFGINHPKTAGCYNNIGVIYLETSDFSKALTYFQKGLEIREKVFGIKHPETAISYNNIGMIYLKTGNFSQALIYLQKGLDIQEKILGINHSETANSYGNIGAVYMSLKNYQQALIYFKKTIEIRENILKLKHPDSEALRKLISLLEEE